MRRLSGLFSGILDSGFSALANFAMGVFAVHSLGSKGLALYSLFFSGWIVAQLLPGQMAYFPARLAINTSLRVVGPQMLLDVRRGVVPILAAPLLVTLAGLPLISAVPPSTYAGMAVAAAALTVSSPFNAHARSSLHIVGKHGSAALCSAINAFGAIVILLLWFTTNADSPNLISPVVVAFGTVALTNAASAFVGVAILSRVERGLYEISPLLSRLGFVGPDLVAQLSGYFMIVLTNGLLGTVALATLETARIMASPVLVLVSGLSTYFIPKTVRFFARSELLRFRRRLLGMSAAVTLTGVLYASSLALSGHLVVDALGKHANPLLGAARTIASTVDASTAGSGMILYTAHRSRIWNLIAAGGSLLSVALLVPCVLLAGTFGVPLAQALGSASKAAAGLSLAYHSRLPERRNPSQAVPESES